MGNVQMEADQIRYKGSSYKNVQTAVDAALSSSGSTALSDLTDTAITTPSAGQVLKYNSTSSKWENGAEAASGVTYSNTSSHLEATDVQGAIDEMIVNFQDGVDDVYDACVAKGSTPASHSLSDVITAIGNISSISNLVIYVIETKSTTGYNAALTIKKFTNGTLTSSTDYPYADAQTPVTIDDYFILDYGVTEASKWTYKLLEASLTGHAANYTKTWPYSDNITVAEYFSA